ncbi:ParB N-terminal domain-containing protein [Blastopirellula sp. J2-11]|uniref:winged helix-turn-helix transcriptional regulator n=1 Tax=Blastopirellula sp. J2-11 TaxID=2943192 RepID=UPI0021C6B494|nr:ParB N-terminal domain-containing protein [Blastopirellula sp. J2-11]UUO05334.1 ParB N-terminal domain-containing protein [Blastopirellula sp. J2-11]
METINHSQGWIPMATATLTKPRSQKAKMVREALLEQWRRSSDREIATRLGVSNRTVSNHRKQLEEEGLILPRGETTQSVEACHVAVCTSAIRPAWINDKLYDPVDENEPSFLALVANVAELGILEPIVVSADGVILSGHRRHAAACKLQLARIPVRIRYDVSFFGNHDTFMRLLASYNRQRVKTTSEQFREELALASNDAYIRVRRFRKDSAYVDISETIPLRIRKPRSVITQKLELRNAIVRTVLDENPNWPISDRFIFYRLLNIEGLVRNDLTRTPFVNNNACYNDTTDMVTRLRLDGSIPFEAVGDETRPVVIWDMHRCVGDFVRRECEEFLDKYNRDLQQSQPNWVELLVEKNTVASQLRNLAAGYGLPMTSGRGYSSLPPRKAMVDRYRESGRESLVVIVISDFDPEGEDIPCSFGVSLRDDFGITEDRLHIVKAALTSEQVHSLDLHEGQLSKETSSRYERFVRLHGNRAWELESLPSEQLREIVEVSIRSVIDLDAFEAEVEREKAEQLELAEKRQNLRRMLINQDKE